MAPTIFSIRLEQAAQCIPLIAALVNTMSVFIAGIRHSILAGLRQKVGSGRR
jgi:hypothetical protein